MGDDCMESPRSPRVWYFFSSAVPEDELLVPIENEYGLAFAVRPGKMEPEMLDRLNEAADHVLNVGLAHLDTGRAEKPPERKE
ncbi:hypothetical protein QFZ75_003646 [Streptomyces sp. V3I8]|nr:hypothetical protein [Streptomyces sp. V3I8]